MKNTLFLQVSEFFANIKSNPSVLIFSIWISLVYCERYIVDSMVWKVQDKWTNAIFSTGALLCFLACWSPILISMTMSKKITDWIVVHLLKMLHILWSKGGIITIIIALFIIFIFALIMGTVKNESIFQTFIRFFITAKNFIVGQQTVIVAIFVFLLAFIIFKIISNFFKFPEPIINESMKQWIIGAPFIVLSGIFFFFLYRFSIWSEMSYLAQSDFVKDCVLYTLLGIFLVSAMYRFGQCIPLMKVSDRWITFAIFALVSVLVWVITMSRETQAIYDLQNATMLAVKRFPDISQRMVVSRHIWIRDLLIITPLYSSIFMWLLLKIINSPNNIK